MGAAFRILYTEISNYMVTCWRTIKYWAFPSRSLTVFAMKSHAKCRNCDYPRGKDNRRFHVPDDKVSWGIPYPEYNPPDLTTQSVLSGPVWADIEIRGQDDHALVFNKVDGKVNRKSHSGEFSVVNGVPRNPVGRTGITGRGCLGRWGPNHAADPIVTRWKTDETDAVMKNIANGLDILQFVAIQRRDNGDWAIPGGMVDAGEVVNVTLKREFSEEAMNALEATPAERKIIEKNVDAVFSTGSEVYRGYVDDPRNTDNAWMETVAINFHDDFGSSLAKFKLNAGDDAKGVMWMDISSSLQLYASHNDFIKCVAKLHNASW